MSLNGEASESTSEQTIGDFDIDAVAGLTNPVTLPSISSVNIEASRGSSPGSILSSAPSGLLTPTVGSNPGEDGYTVGSGGRIYERRKRIRQSWVYFPENGSEYTTVDGKTRWRCARCKSYPNKLSMNRHST